MKKVRRRNKQINNGNIYEMLMNKHQNDIKQLNHYNHEINQLDDIVNDIQNNKKKAFDNLYKNSPYAQGCENKINVLEKQIQELTLKLSEEKNKEMEKIKEENEKLKNQPQNPQYQPPFPNIYQPNPYGYNNYMANGLPYNPYNNYDYYRNKDVMTKEDGERLSKSIMENVRQMRLEEQIYKIGNQLNGLRYGYPYDHPFYGPDYTDYPGRRNNNRRKGHRYMNRKNNGYDQNYNDIDNVDDQDYISNGYNGQKVYSYGSGIYDNNQTIKNKMQYKKIEQQIRQEIEQKYTDDLNSKNEEIKSLIEKHKDEINTRDQEIADLRNKVNNLTGLTEKLLKEIEFYKGMSSNQPKKNITNIDNNNMDSNNDMEYEDNQNNDDENINNNISNNYSQEVPNPKSILKVDYKVNNNGNISLGYEDKEKMIKKMNEYEENLKKENLKKIIEENNEEQEENISENNNLEDNIIKKENNNEKSSLNSIKEEGKEEHEEVEEEEEENQKKDEKREEKEKERKEDNKNNNFSNNLPINSAFIMAKDLGIDNKNSNINKKELNDVENKQKMKSNS